MSMAPQALERSVLERKERDELAAIAEAMGVKPSSRASKATLIDTILREAGIETGEERPKRSRRSSSQSNGAATTATAADKASETAQELPGVTAEAGSGNGEAPAPATGGPADSPASAEAEPAPSSGPVEQTAGATGGDGAPDTAPPDAGAPTVAPEFVADAGPAAGSVTTTSTDGGGEAAPAGGPARTDRVKAPTTEATSEVPSTNGADGESGEQAGATASAPASTTAPERTGVQPGGRDGDRGQQRGDQQRTEQQRGDQRDGRGNRGSQGDMGEPGNRRSRRRRGRDRGERDLQQDRGPEPSQYQGELVATEGLLDLRDEGYGFLRSSGYLPGPRDAYVSLSQVRRFALRKGDYIKGAARPAASNEKYPALLRIDTVNDMTPEEARSRPRFEDLTPLFPDQKLRLEIPGDSNNMIARIVDLISPIGKGQRGLIVSPPKAGKTTVLKQIAHSIEANNPEVKLFVLLVDERPEEVTDFRRSVKGEVVSSTFDRPSEEHTQVAELTLERAKRLVELRQDVVIVLDGITRLARAYNLA
ncbi:MAG: transcription termination factor Rho, partial [Actinomycetota bacterium]|nr:transcription termination factor Rho [Actinomycetota bacterium]